MKRLNKIRVRATKEVAAIIANRNNKKTPGSDEISNLILKKLFGQILDWIVLVTNSVLSLGHFLTI